MRYGQKDRALNSPKIYFQLFLYRNGVILKPSPPVSFFDRSFRSFIISCFIIFTLKKILPRMIIFTLGNNKNQRRLNRAEWSIIIIIILFLAINSHTMNAVCEDALSWSSSFFVHNSGRTRRTRSRKRF